MSASSPSIPNFALHCKDTDSASSSHMGHSRTILPFLSKIILRKSAPETRRQKRAKSRFSFHSTVTVTPPFLSMTYSAASLNFSPSDTSCTTILSPSLISCKLPFSNSANIAEASSRILRAVDMERPSSVIR